MGKHKLCPRCGKEAAIIHRRLGILPGKLCLAEGRKTSLTHPPEFATQSQTNRVSEERSKNAVDTIQPWVGKNHDPNPDFVKNYPDKAEEYFSKEQLKKL